MLNKNILGPESIEQAQTSFDNFAQLPLAILKEWEKADLDVEFTLNGQSYELKTAQNKQDLVEAKILDDLAFGSHLGITMNELVAIAQNGKVILLYNQAKQLVGEFQIITSPIPEHPHLDSDEAYAYGVAIHPSYQNQGLSQVFNFAQELVAGEAGKTKVTLTVRLENAQSIKAQLKAGYKVVGYDKDHYGDFEHGGARLLMEKKLDELVINYDAQVLSTLVNLGVIPIINDTNAQELIKKNCNVALPVAVGDEIDLKAHQLIQKIFQQSYEGIGLLKPNEYGGKNPQISLLILKPLTEGKHEKK